MAGTARRLRSWLVRPLLILLLLGAVLVGWRYGTGNTGTVIPGSIYRSAQLSPSGLDRLIRRHGIRTVVNLRGCNPDQAWYEAERRVTLSLGATQVDVPMASDQWLSRAQVRTLLDLLDSSPRPVLIHCEWGAERTGLLSAMAALLRSGGTLEDGRNAFSIAYLFLPIKDGRIMRGHVDRYAHWLRSQGLGHTPDRFRMWLTTIYEPGSPSRQEWPFDPYPLVVVTQPGRAQEATAPVTGTATRLDPAVGLR